MKSLNVKNKLGSTHLMDPKTDLFLTVPQGFRLYAATGRFWIGGHQDSGEYLHIERISSRDNIPTILAEGDLDMYLATKNHAEKLSDKLSGVWVSGTIGRNDIMGYLIKVEYSKTDSYLVLVARVKSDTIGSEKSLAIEIGQAMIK